MKMWMQFNVMRRTSLGVDAVYRHAQEEQKNLNIAKKRDFWQRVISAQKK